MFVQQLGFIELAIIHRSTYNRSVCNSSSTAWRWYSYQELSSFKVNAKYSTKKFKGVKKVFIISPHSDSPQEKDNNGEDWPKTIGKGRRLRSHNSGLVFCSKHLLNLYGIQNSLFSNDWLGCSKYIFFCLLHISYIFKDIGLTEFIIFFLIMINNYVEQDITRKNKKIWLHYFLSSLWHSSQVMVMVLLRM